MKISIDGQYSLETDENNFILKEVKFYGKDSKNFGDNYYVTVGYYGTMQQALKGYLKYATRNADCGGREITSIQEMVRKLEAIEEKIDRVLKANK